jgi:hypothetical protein
MSATAPRRLPAYLREARIGAGYASRDTAATGIPYSPETIGRHERGDVPVSPEDAVMYAGIYGRDDILVRYCADCPVGNKLQKTLQDREFSLATMRLNNRLDNAAKVARTLSSIADDGQVTDCERGAFVEVLRECADIVGAIKELKLWAYTAGITTPEEIKGAAPVAPGNDSARK